MLPTAPAWLPTDAEIAKAYVDSVHYSFYRARLTEYIARLLPERGPCSLLDIGAGDGSMGSFFQRFRPDTAVCGVETHLRRHMRAAFPIVRYDGCRLPIKDRSVDVALLANVVHHATDQFTLLTEACRVARRRVILKDHLCEGAVDRWLLALLDVLGNRRFGASTTGTYRSGAEWTSMFARINSVRVTRYDGLTFRQGLLQLLFPNSLEVMFVLDAS